MHEKNAGNALRTRNGQCKQRIKENDGEERKKMDWKKRKGLRK